MSDRLKSLYAKKYYANRKEKELLNNSPKTAPREYKNTTRTPLQRIISDKGISYSMLGKKLGMTVSGVSYLISRGVVKSRRLNDFCIAANLTNDEIKKVMKGELI